MEHRGESTPEDTGFGLAGGSLGNADRLAASGGQAHWPLRTEGLAIQAKHLIPCALFFTNEAKPRPWDSFEAISGDFFGAHFADAVGTP